MLAMLKYSFFYALNLFAFAHGSCESFLYDILNCYGIYDVHPAIPTDSITTLCDQYYPICPSKNMFMTCYINAISTCDSDKRLYNPLVMDIITVRSVLYGCCMSKGDFDSGKDCVGSKYNDVHAVISNICFVISVVTQISVEAVSSGNWTDLCTSIDESYNCIHDLLLSFNCTSKYESAYTKLIYAAIPPYCTNDSTAFGWIEQFGYSWSKGTFPKSYLSLIAILPFLQLQVLTL